VKLHAIGRSIALRQSVIGKVTTTELSEIQSRKDSVLIWPHHKEPQDQSGYLAILTPDSRPSWEARAPLIHSVPKLSYLSTGDVIYLGTDGFVRTLYRRDSPHNFILFTDQCNSYCLMCSQPPKPINDFSRIREHYRLIDLIDPETPELGITGGEPTLFKDHFVKFIEHCNTKLPNTALHVLTNGRLFYYREFARQLGNANHPDIMLGIPLYSDVDSEHDYVVQAKGAFEETVIGLHHLARYGVPVEIRVVVHKQTYGRLPQLAEFITRNLPFAAHVALMGMEMTGFVNSNSEALWIDPIEYQPELAAATDILATAGLNVSIYNHQLCILDHRLWPFARKSISDWKNIYIDACQICKVRDQCGGLFQSSEKKHSAHIRPVLDLA